MLKSTGLKIIHAEDEICKYFQLSEEIYLSLPIMQREEFKP